MPHIFFLRNYLFRTYEIHTQYNWMSPLHMLFFHVTSIYVYGLKPVRNKGMSAFPVQARFLFAFPCPHCTNHALAIFKTCPTQCILQWPKKMKILWPQIMAIGWMGEHSPTKFGDCLLGSQTCVRAGVVALNQHVSWIPVRLHLLLTLFQFLKGFEVRVQIDYLTSGNHIYQNLWAGDCGRTPRQRSIMQLRFSTS